MSGMTISQQGINELIGSEGLRLKAYQDQGKVWTIGYGHTGHINGVPIGAGMTITKDQADTILRKKLREFENAVNSSVKVPLSQNQFDALVSLAYNVGGGAFRRSSIPTYLNNGDFQKAADAILEFNKSRQNGEPRASFNKGLFNRRVKEREMFLGGKKVDAPMPENQFPIYDNLNVEPKQVAPQTTIEPSQKELSNNTAKQPDTDYFTAFTDSFNQLNGTLDAFAPQEEPTLAEVPPAEKPDYSKQLASAFGIAPSTQGKIPDYFGEMIKSIYDKTA